MTDTKDLQERLRLWGSRNKEIGFPIADEAADALARLEATLDRYGDHDEDCGRIEESGPRCTCGFLEAMSGAGESEVDRLRAALEDIASGDAFRIMRYADDDDSDYFLRAQRRVQFDARAALTGSTTDEAVPLPYEAPLPDDFGSWGSTTPEEKK